MSSCELLQVQQRSWYVEEEQVVLNRSKKLLVAESVLKLASSAIFRERKRRNARTTRTNLYRGAVAF